MSTIGIVRLVDGVPTSADSAFLSIMDNAGILLVDTQLVVASAAGTYSYDVSFLQPGRFTVQWRFEVDGFADDLVSRIFNVDAPVSVIRGVTLADIERAVARVVGPYHRFRTKVGSTQQIVLVSKLKSTLSLGDYEEMHLLRRAEYYDGSQVTGAALDDRHRIVDIYDNATGSLNPDQDWTIAPVENEMIELHALDPEDELRPAVQEGLSRCYFWDTVSISSTGYLREINITDIAPWITRKDQISRVEYGRTTGLMTSKVPYFNAYDSAGSVYLQQVSPNVGTLKVFALRPVSSFVNSEYSATGPNDDTDILNVDLRYAKLAGHASAWENFPDRLQPLAVNGLRAPHDRVAAAFSHRSRAVVGNLPEFIQHRFGLDVDLENLQIGNA